MVGQPIGRWVGQRRGTHGRLSEVVSTYTRAQGHRTLYRQVALTASLLAALVVCPTAEAQVVVRPLHSSFGRADIGANGTVLTATGQSSAVGRSLAADGGLLHVGGWVSNNPALAEDDPFRLTNVRVAAVTPDSAVVSFEVSHPAEAVVRFGPDDNYGEEIRVDRRTAVRLPNLDAGGLYHWRLDVTDRDGRRRATRDLTLCTPAIEELTTGLLEASYYRGRNFEELVTVRPEVGVDQPGRSDNDPDGDFRSNAGPDNFSVRWNGLVRAREEGLYSWRTRQDDGIRLYVDGLRRIDQWTDANGTLANGASTRLDAGWHALTVEFFNGIGPAYIRTDMRVPGGRLRTLRADDIAYVGEDFFKPTIQPRDEEAQYECSGPNGARVQILPPEVLDCHDPNVRVTSDQPGQLPLGGTRVVWTAENGLGYRTHYAEIVEIVDTTPPRVAAPDPVTVEARSPQGTVVQMPEPSALDLCDEELEFSYEICTDAQGAACQACWTTADEQADPIRVAGARNPRCNCVQTPSRFGVGVTTVTVIATDDGGNCAGAPFDVAVRDTTPPTIVAGEIGPICDEAPIPQPTVRDNATATEEIIVTCAIDDGAAGSCDGFIDLAFGGHTITYVATDAAGHRARATLEFTVGDEDPAPPTVTLLAATEGYTNGVGAVTFRIRDNCDPDPGYAFNPTGDNEIESDDEFTAEYDREGVFSVTLTADDFAGNETVITAAAFGVDRTAPSASFSGLDEPEEIDDVLTWPVFFPQDTVTFNAGARDRDGVANSGVGRLLVELVSLDTDELRVLLDHVPDAEGVPLAGPDRLKNIKCAEVLSGDDAAYCDDEGDLSLADVPPGDYELVTRVTDRAGNAAELRRYLVVMNWRVAMERTIELTDGLLEAGGLPALSELFLGVIPDIGDEALAAVDDPDLLGNALLNTSTMIAMLQFAESEDVDTADSRAWLTQGALDSVRNHRDGVAERVAVDDSDLVAADSHLEDSAEELAGQTYQASVLSLINAYFRLRHADAPFIVETPAEAAAAAARLQVEFVEYVGIDHAGGQDDMADILAIQRGITGRNLFSNAFDNPNAGAANANFLDLMENLVELSERLQAAQDDSNVWVRNWQWPVGLQVRTMAGAALQLTAAELGDDFDDPQNPLLAFTKGVYDDGVELIEDRLVDDALVLYVDNRCLIYEVYNHGGFAPQGVPPDAWECEECVLTGDCEH